MVYILGLDVSMNSTGWGVLKKDKNAIHYVDSGVIKVNTKNPHGKRLREQREKFHEIVKIYPVKFVAMESGFARHIKSTQVLFKAYGVAEEYFSNKNLVEYPATTIKKVVTGSGKATKEQVEAVVRKELNLQDYKFLSDDESDALAVALALIKEKQL